MLNRRHRIAQESRQDRKRKATQAEIMEAVQSGDPIKMADMAVKYPEFSGAMKNRFGFTNEVTERHAREAYRRALSDPANAIQYMQKGVELVSAAGGNPTMMANDLQMLQTNPEAAMQAIKMGYAGIDPQGYRSQFGDPGRIGASTKSFAPVTIVNPITGEKKLVSPTFDPATGKAELSPFDMPEGFELSTETPEEKRQANILAKGQEKQAVLEAELATKPKVEEQIVKSKARAKKVEAAFNQMEKIRGNIINLDEGITAIDEGASSGVIASKLPSFRAASQKLDNVANRLGLDVVSSVTFGALSERELEMAKKTALPTNMEPQALRQWMVDKKEALEKLSDYLYDQAQFMQEGTRAEWEAHAKEKYRQQAGNIGDLVNQYAD